MTRPPPMRMTTTLQTQLLSVCCRCGLEVETNLLWHHEIADCTERLVACELCMHELPHSELAMHEAELCIKRQALMAHGLSHESKAPGSSCSLHFVRLAVLVVFICCVRVYKIVYPFLSKTTDRCRQHWLIRLIQLWLPGCVSVLWRVHEQFRRALP